ncbi:MAG: 3-hydroxyacyl-CoA dehydrogenase family protein [Candidatus Bathyarchaeia archaeon]
MESIRKVGVIGAGIMGHGIAQVFAQAGFTVSLTARREETLKQALERIRSNIQFFVQHKLAKDNAADIVLSRIRTTTNLRDAVSDVDFVLEAVPEVIETKREVFRSLDSYCAEDIVLATNASSLTITEIASATRRPERVVGAHFWNPAHLMPLVEVTKGEHTSEKTMGVTCDLMSKIGKVPARVLKDLPGGIGNRIQVAMWREAISLLDQGAASAEDIDNAVMLTFGARLPFMGPFLTADLNGVDLILNVHSYLYRFLYNACEPAPVLREKVERGEFGVKTGKGFYTWTKETIEKARARRDEGLINAFRPLLEKQLQALR